MAWYCLVMPSLVLNYFGQGALLMHDPKAIENPFFLLAPDWALLPLVVLSTVATVIASQAVISGAYSLTSQAIQLGYVPRMKILHTSDLAIGQIYVPVVNWMLLFIILCIVIGFKSSENLAAAYGLAVTATMIVTTMLASRRDDEALGLEQGARDCDHQRVLPGRPWLFRREPAEDRAGRLAAAVHRRRCCSSC